ncbi:MAG: hypothetical protein K8I29_08055 [Alphaproteobacteria bacterium]|uniref:Tetratricopeptide repeat protein n=1 Tax=Candidatus Nitrobium versatile TaxID=2884831 RepID=A0A953LZX5_9BACT|nr:hypothetical protein [Candidatus Nitrobium versatile]
MHDPEAHKLFIKGLTAFNQGKMLSALAHFEKADSIERSPLTTSYLALCIASQRGQIRKAISLCEEAIQADPETPAHYLNLGKVYLLGHNKEEAIRVFREGLKYEVNQMIIDELVKLETRKPPVIRFLARDNPLNKYLGILLKKLGLR